MEKKTDSLSFKFALIFIIFTLVTLLMSGLNTYFNQMNSYKAQREDNIQNIAKYIEELLIKEGDDFICFQNYFLEHYEEILVPMDFSGDYRPEQSKFEKLFAEQYPGKAFGVDIKFDELSNEVKMAYTIYKFEYYLNVFEKARDSFGITYAYYLVPTKEELHMYWLIDALREERIVNGASYITLCTDVYEKPEEHEKMWEAWNTGKSPEGYDIYDNEYGHTYAYYRPLFINDKKIGVIGTEVEVAAVNSEILNLTLEQIGGMGAILIACVLIMMWFINRRYIVKLSHLQSDVRDYSNMKDPAIASKIEKEAIGNDEIADLAKQTAAMILELENYMANLLKTSQDLSLARKTADVMNELATTDALTGIKNKTAYDNEVRRIEKEMTVGSIEFGIAMIDLNFLKRLNDTFGHERGNIAIKKLSHIVTSIFENSKAFRIGGDEFVVILENEDYKNVYLLVDMFRIKLENMKSDDTLEEWEKISASIGVALYDPITDDDFASVFKRADKLMYKNKKAMKAMRTD